MIKKVAPWYVSPLVRHALQLPAMSATVPDVRHTCDQRATHLVLGQFRYHFPNVSSVQTWLPLADIQMHFCAHTGLIEPVEPPEDGEIDE